MAITEQPVGTVATPNNLTEASTGSVVAPNDLTESSAGSSSTPVNLTESTSGSVDTPANLTESSVVSASTPVNLTESTSGAVATPVNLTESSVGSTATPVNLTESGAGSIAVPVNLAEQAVASIPRPLVPLVGMNFTKNRYAQDGEEVAFDDLFTYSRNSNATYWNRRLDQNGKWETFLDTDIVGSVENLQLHSESFDHSDWGKSNLTVIANATNNHFGVRLADEIVEDDYNGTHILSDGNAFTSGSTYAFSVYVKANGRGQVRISAGNLTTFDASSDFDINSGVVLRSLNGHASITYERDGWWRCTVIGLSSSTGTTNVNIYPAIGLNTNYQGDGTSGVYIWGAQLTESAKPLPYIKTTLSTTAQTIVELPRIEYDPVTAEAKGVLIEGASTNLFLRSEEFDNASWTKATSTLTPNTLISPDETTSADKVAATSTTTAYPHVHQAITSVAAQTYTSSFYVKKAEAEFVQLRYAGGEVANNPRANFDLTNGTLGTVDADIAATITNCGNGWYKISSTATAVGTALKTHLGIIATATDSNAKQNSWTAGDGIYIWGAQAENLPFASSYIRTEGAAASRVVDNLQASGYGNTNSSIGTLFLEGAPYAATTGTQNVLNINDGTTSNRVVIRATSATNKTNTLVVADGVTEAQFSTADSWDSSQKTVLTYEQNSVVTYIDGLALNTDTSAAMPTGITTIDIGQSSASQKQWYGHISSTEIYEEAMTAQEVSLIGSGSIKARTMLSDVMTTPSSSAYSGYKYSLLDYAKIDGSNMTGIDVGDNVTIKMGDGDDLRIYHGGSNSYIDDTGTGNLIIKGQNVVIDGSNNERIATFAENGAVTLKYDNGTKFATTSTGIDVTGTVTADKLKAEGTEPILFFNDTTTGHDDWKMYADWDQFFIQQYVNDSTWTSRLHFAANGNATFSGTATMDGLSVQSTSASATVASFKGSSAFGIELAASAVAPYIQTVAVGSGEELAVTSGGNKVALFQDGGDISFYEDTGTTVKLFWDASAESLGIGTSSPSYPFHLSGSGDTVAAVTAGASSVAALNLGNATNLADGGIRYDNSANALILRASNAERMRIDSSGNLLVGKSSSSFTTAGVELAQGGTAGKVQIQRSSSPLTLVNLTDDGNILNFYKGTATVGSIGSTDGTDLQIGSGNCYLRFDDATNQILPTNAAGAKRDAAFDLGDSDARFVDIYATNGTIQTSDRNEKQDIEELSDAEQRVAVACKGLLRKFRFKSSVEEKGDDARIHFGIIAQDLQDAFTAEGLDAGRYAMFISTTWTDEETGEERTRMGVRYSELLAFIIAAI